MTLADFLFDRVAEAEHKARRCAETSPSPWHVQCGVPFMGAFLTDDAGHHVFTGTDYGPDSRTNDEAALHIASWDPARVLAECEAKRRIVELHGPEPGFVDRRWLYCKVCVRFHADIDCENEAWPCPTLRLLALPYADHPDYRPEWSLVVGGLPRGQQGPTADYGEG